MEKDIILFDEKPTVEEKNISNNTESSDSNDTQTGTKSNESGTNPESFQEAFNEETNEINWDCPCIADLVKPPCGDQFKEAFSCFVYSKEEPRGSDCIDQFREMQSCFMKHPEIYGADEDTREEDKEDEQEKQ